MAKNVPAVKNKADMAVLDAALDAEPAGFEPQAVTVKVAHQQQLFSIAGMPTMNKMEGIILAARMVRTFFPRTGDETETEELLAFTSTRPFCRSDDYTHGTLVEVEAWPEKPDAIANIMKEKIAEGGLNCHVCPLGGEKAWGSVGLFGGSGNRKACAELRRLLYWRQGITVPVILSVPPSSIKRWDGYCSGLQMAGVKYSRVVTEIRLESRKGKGGENYSVFKFEMTDAMDEKMAAELLEHREFRGEDVPLVTILIDLFKGRELSIEDYPDNGTAEKKEEDF